MTTLYVGLKTGSDDLRSDCYANFSVKVAGNPQLLTVEHFVGGQPKNSESFNEVDFPAAFDPIQIEFFQLLHVSVEHFPETPDNWDLTWVAVYVDPNGPSIAFAGPWRFTGNSRLLTFYSTPASG
jgi:hypothetical protein